MEEAKGRNWEDYEKWGDAKLGGGARRIHQGWHGACKQFLQVTQTVTATNNLNDTAL